MNERRHIVGVFDSGIGGMSVVKEIKALMPLLDIVYVGDNKRAPYGNRSEEEVKHFAKEMLVYLKGQGCTHFVSACNSISVLLTKQILDEAEIGEETFIEMVKPTTTYFANARKRKLIVLATMLTTKSKLYEDSLKAFTEEYVGVGEPNLAKQIEENESKEAIAQTVSSFFDVHGKEPGTLLLSCTHYPLVKHIFEEEIKKRNVLIEIIDPSFYVAKELELKVDDTNGNGSLTIYATKESQAMDLMATHFGQKGYNIISLV